MNLLIIFFSFLVCTISYSKPDEIKSYETITIPVKSNLHWISGNILATYKKDSKDLQFFNISTGEHIKTLPLGLPVTKIRSWSINTPKEEERYLYILSNLNNLNLDDANDGTKYPCSVKIVNIGTQDFVVSHIVSDPNYTNIAANIKSGLIYLFSKKNNKIDIISERTGQKIKTLSPDEQYYDINPHGEYGLSIDNKNNILSIFSLDTQEKKASFNYGHKKLIYPIYDEFFFTTDACIIATYTMENNTFTPVGLIHNDKNFTKYLSLDNHLITYDKGEYLKIWELPNPPTPKYSIRIPNIKNVSSNSKIIAASTGKEIIILNKKRLIPPLSTDQKICKALNATLGSWINSLIKHPTYTQLTDYPSKSINHSNTVD